MPCSNLASDIEKDESVSTRPGGSERHSAASTLALRGRAFWNYVWSLADLDADVSAALTQFMTLYRSLFALLIRRVNSALSEREALRLAAALSSMIDGIGSVVGEGRPAAADLVCG